MSGGLTVSESALLAENEALKGKYEDLLKEHETLIQTLEALEGKQTEAVVAKEEVKQLEKKYGELKEMLEKLEKAVEYLNSCDEIGVDSGVIEISSDEEENQRESNGVRGGEQSNSQNQEKGRWTIPCGKQQIVPTSLCMY